MAEAYARGLRFELGRLAPTVHPRGLFHLALRTAGRPKANYKAQASRSADPEQETVAEAPRRVLYVRSQVEAPLALEHRDNCMKGALSLVSNFFTAGVSSSVRKLHSVTLEASHPEGSAA